MKIIVIILFITLSVLPAIENHCFAGASSGEDELLKTEVTVDASQLSGDMPGIFKAGVFENWENILPDNGLRYLQKKYFSGVFPGITTIFVPLWSESFDDFKRKVEQEGVLEPALREAKEVISGQGEVLFDIQTMPRWLSSNLAKGEFWRYPPKNYDAWRNLVAYTVNYFYRNGVKGASYRIWEEVDIGITKDLKFWNGTKEEFCKLYEYSVLGILSVDPGAMVTFGLAGYDNEILPAMAAYVSKKNLPLDYIIWHPFRTPPDPPEFEQGVENIKRVVQRSGLKRKVKVHAESWNSWLDFGKPNLPNGWPDERSSERDTEYNAAFAVQQLYALDKGGVQGHSFFSRVDFSHIKLLQAGAIGRNQQFYGGFGMFTRDLVVKPVFNAFRTLSILSGKEEGQISNRLRTDFDETDFITAIAAQTRDRTRIRVLLANYIPPDQLMPKGYVKRKQNEYLQRHYGDAIKPMMNCFSKGGALKECKSLAPQDMRNYLTCIDAGEKDKCSAIMPGHLHQFIQNTTEYVKQQKQKPKKVVLSLENIPFSGRASLTTYTIDKEHSNSCRYNKGTERKSSGTECGIDGEIDTMIREARREAEETAQKITKEHPSLYPVIKGIEASLFYTGSYALPNGKVSRTSMYIDKINSDPRVSLEGSKQVKEIRVGKGGSYTETVFIKPHGIVLMEISKVK